MAKGRNVVNLSDDDYKGATFKVAPAGKYEVTVTPKTKVGKSKSGGAKIEIHAKIAKGEHKGISFFDHVAASVTWKVAQVLLALGVKKKSITLEEIVKLLIGTNLRAVLMVDKYEGKKNNKVVQWLPLKAADDDDGDDEEDDDDDADDSDDADDDADDSGDDDDSDDDADDDDADDADDDDDDADDSDDDDDDADQGDDDDDDADEPEPEPKKKSTKKKQAAAKKSTAKKSAAKKSGRRK
jgi:cobalamin biosynthesis protein CobT